MPLHVSAKFTLQGKHFLCPWNVASDISLCDPTGPWVSGVWHWPQPTIHLATLLFWGDKWVVSLTWTFKKKSSDTLSCLVVSKWALILGRYRFYHWKCGYSPILFSGSIRNLWNTSGEGTSTTAVVTVHEGGQQRTSCSQGTHSCFELTCLARRGVPNLGLTLTPAPLHLHHFYLGLRSHWFLWEVAQPSRSWWQCSLKLVPQVNKCKQGCCLPNVQAWNSGNGEQERMLCVSPWGHHRCVHTPTLAWGGAGLSYGVRTPSPGWPSNCVVHVVTSALWGPCA